jgi:hypothetical protein
MHWSPQWFSATSSGKADLWRAVEAQHVISTMRLVESAADQEVLERMLEESKPTLPVGARNLAFLLSTPFRYVSRWPSRFRPAGEPGIWYGAEKVETACAEVGYWRWRFQMDSDGLRARRVFIEFTMFQARIAGVVVDLTGPPWARAKKLWMHPSDYTACHEMAAAAREREVQWIRYASVRDPTHGICGAALEPRALSLPRPTLQQTWAARVQADMVAFSHSGKTVEFDANQWISGSSRSASVL